MFVDINAYVGHWPFRNLEFNNLTGLDTLAQECGITHMVIANLNGLFYKDANVANFELYDELSAYSGRTKFLPLAIVNPTYPKWEDDARNMIAHGFCGFELAPLYHGFSLALEMLYDEYFPIHRAGKVMQLAEEFKLPVRINAGFENYRGRSLKDVENNISGEELFALLSQYENVNTIITGINPASGGVKLCELIKKRNNIYFDTTQMPLIETDFSNWLNENCAYGQICFGSLSPFNYIETNLVRIEFAQYIDAQKVMQNGASPFGIM